jgi:methionyl-tRNA formyltransferase
MSQRTGEILLLSREPEGELLAKELKKIWNVRIEYTDCIQSKESDYKMIVSHHYPHIIKGEELKWVQNFTNLNIHNTFLPYGRGIYGIMWGAYFNTPQGFTLHALEERVDAGKVLYQEAVEYQDSETLKELWYRIENQAVSYFLNNLDSLQNLYNNARYVSKLESGFYKNKRQSESLLRQLPNGFETPISIVKQLREKKLIIR